MRFYLRRLPIEVFSIFCPTIALCMSMFAWASCSSRDVFFLDTVESVWTLMWTSNPVLIVAFLFFWVLLSSHYIWQSYRRTLSHQSQQAIVSLSILQLSYGTISMALSFSLIYLFYLVEPTRVYATSLAIFHVETGIFGSMPSFWLIQHLSHTILESAILYSYFHLFLVFSSVVILTALRNTLEFRRLLLSFYLAYGIAIPIYALIPVLYPDALFSLHVFPEFTEPIPEYLSFSNQFSMFRTLFNGLWISPESAYLSVSAFPSLHAAWGLIATISVWRVHRPLRWVFIAWCILNAIGTFYTLQHFMLDTIAGLVLGAGVYYVSTRLLAFENTYYQGKPWFTAIDRIQHVLTKHTS